MEIEFDVYCNNEWCAGSNDLDEAMNYAKQYAEDGAVEVYKIEKKITLIALLSSKDKK